MDNETWEKIKEIDGLTYKVAFENGDSKELRKKMEDLLGKEVMEEEMKKRTKPDQAYDSFDYGIIMIDIIRDRFYKNDPDYLNRLFGEAIDAIDENKMKENKENVLDLDFQSRLKVQTFIYNVYEKCKKEGDYSDLLTQLSYILTKYMYRDFDKQDDCVGFLKFLHFITDYIEKNLECGREYKKSKDHK